MSGAPYAVDLDLLVETIAALTSCERTCDAALDEIRRDVVRLHLTWGGVAADAQLEAQQGWESGFAQMRAGLAAMRAAAVTADRNYRSAVSANLTMWESL